MVDTAEAVWEASVSPDVVELESEISQLRVALKSREVIGQATGMVMAQEGLTREEALMSLVRLSQNSNTKLRDIAQRLVEAWEAAARNNRSR